jgi:hypothetical protein
MAPSLISSSPRPAEIVAELGEYATRALAAMYVPEERLFAFRVVRTARGVQREGLSRRYSAITLIGLATARASAAAILHGHSLEDVCDRLIGDVDSLTDIGDAALADWAAHAIHHRDSVRARRRLCDLIALSSRQRTVETAWALAALTISADAATERLRGQLASRLAGAFDPDSGLFAHAIDARASARRHVCCFADQVYPIFALSLRAARDNDRGALTMATECASRICDAQGRDGQWWWHYDHRTGRVLEPFPVYAIHQDAMAPMALFALEQATSRSWTTPVERGLSWLASSPELAGDSLIDRPAGMVWRKVARREPVKAARALQAAAARVHPDLRVPGVDRLFPPGTVDYEDRPYHWGWFLYAWAATPAARRLSGSIS